jgi:hypothetical protein
VLVEAMPSTALTSTALRAQVEPSCDTFCPLRECAAQIQQR